MGAFGANLDGAGLAAEPEVALLEIEWGQAEEGVVGAVGAFNLHGAAIGEPGECRGGLRGGYGIQNRHDGGVFTYSQVERVLGGDRALET